MMVRALPTATVCQVCCGLDSSKTVRLNVHSQTRPRLEVNGWGCTCVSLFLRALLTESHTKTSESVTRPSVEYAHGKHVVNIGKCQVGEKERFRYQLI